MTEPVWVLEDPRAGTANQALGIAERLGVPFRRVALGYGRLATLPWPYPTLAGLADRSAFVPPWPRIAVSAGRRAAPTSRWLRARGVRTVHAMRPGLGAADFDLLVIGEHDDPAPLPNVFVIHGATHRVTPATLAAAPPVPGLEVALLLGGPVRGEGMDPARAVSIAREAARLGHFLYVTTSRRTGAAAGAALAAALHATPHALHRFGGDAPNPYLSLLAHARHLVVTADSISMLSEAMMSAAHLWTADPGGLGPRHRRMVAGLHASGRAALLGGRAPTRHDPLDETGRVAAEIRARGFL